MTGPGEPPATTSGHQRRPRSLIVCLPVHGGLIDSRWSRADRLAIAQIRDGQIASWQEVEVGWSWLHNQPTPTAHQARIARVLHKHDVQVVLAEQIEDPMARMLHTSGLTVHLGCRGDARAAVLAATTKNGA